MSKRVLIKERGLCTSPLRALYKNYLHYLFIVRNLSNGLIDLVEVFFSTGFKTTRTSMFVLSLYFTII